MTNGSNVVLLPCGGLSSNGLPTLELELRPRRPVTVDCEVFMQGSSESVIRTAASDPIGSALPRANLSMQGYNLAHRFSKRRLARTTTTGDWLRSSIPSNSLGSTVNARSCALLQERPACGGENAHYSPGSPGRGLRFTK